MSLAIAAKRLKKANPNILADVRPMVERLRDVFGVPVLAELLDIDASNLSKFLAGRRSLSGEVRLRAIDLDHVLTSAAQVFVGRAIFDWLTGHSVSFGGARPIDVLADTGAPPLLEELSRIASGAYA